MGDIDRVAPPHGQAVAGCPELLWRAHQGGDLVTALEGLIDEPSTDTAGGAENEQSHGMTSIKTPPIAKIAVADVR
jgi:hypothetical protein